MSIWVTPLNFEALHERQQGSMSDFLEIEFLDIGDDFLTARMPVNEKTRQPIGIMHGGASCVLAETVGSVAGNFCVDLNTHYCVGLDINTNHIRSIKSGWVTATAKPIHLGRSTQVWGIEIHNNDGKLISINRLTMAVLARKA